jgi:group I intron endonuclease
MLKVYLIENKTNNKKYIGITKKSIEARFKSHLSAVRQGSKFRFHSAIRKYGEENFTITLLEECNSDEIYKAETKWIKFYNSKSYDHGYNMTDGGEGCVGRECLPETSKKLSVSLKIQRSTLSKDDLKKLTASANKIKKGYKESEKSRKLKSEAQTKRFAKMTFEEKKEHGIKSRNNISEEGKKNQTAGWNNTFSPVREKGYKQQLTSCPHCDKIGGEYAMRRYHFDNCRNKE